MNEPFTRQVYFRNLYERLSFKPDRERRMVRKRKKCTFKEHNQKVLIACAIQEEMRKSLTVKISYIMAEGAAKEDELFT